MQTHKGGIDGTMEWRITEMELFKGSRIISVKLRNPVKNGWGVFQNDFRLSVDGEWDLEPIPSSRTEEWVHHHTFYSLERAKKAAERKIKED